MNRYLPDVVLDYPLGVALPLGASLLAVATYSTTFPEHHNILRYFRLLIFLPTANLLTVAWFPKGYDAPTTAIFFWFTWILFLKAFDVMVVGFGDKPEDVPRWVEVKWLKKEEKEELRRVPLSLPNNMKDRVVYTIDSICTIQGGSFFPSRAWDWAPDAVSGYRSGGREAYLRRKSKEHALEWFMLDLLNTILTSHKWDSYSLYPLTGSGMSLFRQMLWAGVFGNFLFWSMFPHLHFPTLAAVYLFNLTPESFAPLWREPWEADSLADMWSYRWHWNFRRCYDRATLPLVRALRPYLSRRAVGIVRMFAIFGLSTIYHLASPLTMEGRWPRLTMFEIGTIKFFMSQPLGILLERAAISPLTEQLPVKHKVLARRIFLWTWLLYTGRWFMDSFLRQGVLEDMPTVFPIYTLYHKYWDPVGYLGWGIKRPSPFATVGNFTT